MVTAHLPQHRGTTTSAAGMMTNTSSNNHNHNNNNNAFGGIAHSQKSSALSGQPASATNGGKLSVLSSSNSSSKAASHSHHSQSHHQNHGNGNGNGPTITIPNPDELDIKQFVPALSCVLCQITQRNDKTNLDSTQLTVFHASRPPSITVQAYLERLVKYAYCSSECFVLAIIYLDRIIQKNASFLFTSLNVHRLLITGVMIAAKFFDDTYYNNAYYARVGGIPTAELNILELKFLHMVDFCLHVTPDLFHRYKRELLMYNVPPPSPTLTISSSQSPPHSPMHQQYLHHHQQQQPNSSPPPIPESPKSPLNLSDMDVTFRNRCTPSPSSAVVFHPTVVSPANMTFSSQPQHHHQQPQPQPQQEFMANGALLSNSSVHHPLAVAATPPVFHQVLPQTRQSLPMPQPQAQQPQPQPAYVGLVHPYPQRVVHVPPANQPFAQYTQFVPHQQIPAPQYHILQQPHLLQQQQQQLQQQQQQIYLLHTAPVSPSCIVPAPTTTITPTITQHHPSRVVPMSSAIYGVPIYDF